jgi:rubredoxin
MTQPILEDFTCPQCHRKDHFYVDVLATIDLNEQGVSLAGSYFADGDFTCVCLSCDYEGKVFEFTKAGEVQS